MVRLLRFITRAFLALLGVLAIICVVIVTAVEIFDFDVPEATVKAVAAYSSGKDSIGSPFGRVKVETAQQADGLHVTASCVACEIKSEHLASVPFRTSAAQIIGVMKDKKFKGTAVVEGIEATLDATWDGFSGAGDFTVPRYEIAALYGAVRQIVPEAARAKITGTLEGRGSFRWPSLEILFVPTVKDFSVEGLVDDRYKSGPFEYRAKDAGGREVTLTGGESTPSWAPLTGLGEYLPRAAIAAEDYAFYSHPGYDLGGMREASEDNLKAGGIKRGGSTITQQLAKNLFLSGERTYARKLRELLYTVELERKLSKGRILELYLNVVEFGPGIRGAVEASNRYFAKAPAELRPEEAAWLAGIIRSPGRAFRRQYLAKKPDRTRLETVLRRMRLPEDEARAAFERPLIFNLPKDSK